MEKDLFLGIQTNYKDADVVIIPAPYEGKVSWGTGSDKGPDAIIEASLQLEHYSLDLKDSISEKVRIHTREPLKLKNKKSEEMVSEIKNVVSKVISDGKKPILLGGSHIVSIGAFEALDHKVSILQIDAHADLKDEYLGSKINHGCVMRRAFDKKLPFVSVGIRDYAKEEKELMDKNNISKNIFGIEFENEQVINKLGKEVYITIDLDGFDPSEVPAVGTPQPGGLRWNRVINLLEEIGKYKKIIGFDVVELAPFKEGKASDFLAAKLTYTLIGYCFLDRFR